MWATKSSAFFNILILASESILHLSMAPIVDDFNCLIQSLEVDYNTLCFDVVTIGCVGM